MTLNNLLICLQVYSYLIGGYMTGLFILALIFIGFVIAQIGRVKDPIFTDIREA